MKSCAFTRSSPSEPASARLFSKASRASKALAGVEGIAMAESEEVEIRENLHNLM